MKQAVTTPHEVCPVCGTTPLEHPATGRRRVTCSETCRKKQIRQLDAAKARLLDEVMAAYHKAQWKPKRPAY